MVNYNGNKYRGRNLMRLWTCALILTCWVSLPSLASATVASNMWKMSEYSKKDAIKARERGDYKLADKYEKRYRKYRRMAERAERHDRRNAERNRSQQLESNTPIYSLPSSPTVQQRSGGFGVRRGF